MKCPYCEGNISNKSFKNSYIICCEHCKYIYSLRGPGHLIASERIAPKTTIDVPNFEIGSITLCVDPNHKMFLEYGTVVSNDILHVRIDFNGVMIWMSKTAMNLKPIEW